MSDEILKRIEQNISAQLKWVRLSGMSQLREIFDRTMRTDEEKLAYELSDGERSTRDIEKLTGIGRTKIGDLWKKWHRIGLMEKSAKYEGKRMERSFSLLDAGIEIPTLTQRPVAAQPNTEEFE
jgi:hypothetical protein